MMYSLLASQTFKAYLGMFLVFAACIGVTDPLIHTLFDANVLPLTAQTLVSSFLAEVIGSIGFIMILKRVASDAGMRLPTSLIRTLIVALIYQIVWAINRAPLLLAIGDTVTQKTELSPNSMWVSLVSFSILLIASRWYFFFIPYLLENKSLSESFSSTGKDILFSRKLAIQFIACGIVVSACYEQVTNLIFLENGHDVPILMPDFGASIQWIIGTGLAIAAAMHSLRLSPSGFFQQPIGTRGILPTFFGANGLGKFIVVLLLTAGIQLYQLTTALPSVQFAVSAVNYDQSNSLLTVTLHARDPENTFATFQPLLLRIAGEDGFALSGMTVLTNPENYPQSVLSSPATMDMTVQFKIINRADDFEKLTDVYLYYGSHKLLSLSGQAARGPATSDALPEDATPLIPEPETTPGIIPAPDSGVAQNYT